MVEMKGKNKKRRWRGVETSRDEKAPRIEKTAFLGRMLCSLLIRLSFWDPLTIFELSLMQLGVFKKAKKGPH